MRRVPLLSLRSRLFITHAVILSVVAFLAIAAFWPSQEGVWRAHYREDGLAITNRLINPAQEVFTSGSDRDLRDGFREVLASNPNVAYLVLVDLAGKALVHSDLGRELRVFNDPVGAGAPVTRVPLGHAYFRDTGELIYDLSVPVMVGSEHRGALRVGIPMSVIDSGRRALAARLVLIVLGSLVLAMVASRYVLSINILPLERLAESARRVASGDLDHHIAAKTSDEVGQLASAFNEMVSNLRDSLRQAEDRGTCLTALSQDTLTALITALYYRDHETEGHSRRVVGYSLVIGRKMGLAEADLEALKRGALLHDIGKIGVPDCILHKNDVLSDDDWRIMRGHPVLGCNILAHIEFLKTSLPIIRHHHERFDGKGYPDGLKGLAIPLGARVFSVADAYDAMTSDRPHRRAWPHALAIEEITRHSGTQFDPVAVKAFLTISEREIASIRSESEHQAVDWIEIPLKDLTR